MKTLIHKASVLLAALTVGVGNALAQSGGSGSGFFDNTQGGSVPTVATEAPLGQALTTVVNYFLGILGLVAVGFLIYAGVTLVLSAGNDEAVGKAKNTILYAVIGLVIIALSYTIVNFVVGAIS